MFAAVYTIVMAQLASCHREAGNLDKAIHIQQQCTEIFSQNLPSMRNALYASECEHYRLMA